MESPSVEQAREIVNSIRTLNGGFAEENRAELSADFLRGIENLQYLAGRSIRHVAEDLYDKDTRFIFELLQNAEDNRYGSVLSRNEGPYINFTLHGDRLVVDSNEDGFNEQDIRAICSIHNSSKPLTGGYIGHKGIGFKSVFKVAHRVHIQSGPFCFSFQHHRNDSGLGMITPSNQEHEGLPNEVKTRITLFLIRPDDFDARATELTEISDTLLLFLRKLEKITVNLKPPKNSTFPKASYEYYRDATEVSTRLVKMTNGEEEVKNFIIRKITVSDLPEHPSRQGQDNAEVVLAFPVNASLQPIIEPQYIYSFLPMRREGFNFLIQSDFITQASRQGIHHCQRNSAIRDGICDLFIDAVRDFCHQPSLQYEWLQYLPGLHIVDPFWNDIRETIFDRLKNNRILLTWKGDLIYPETLQHLSSRHCDRHGQPLFDDLEREAYLSPGYNWSQHANDLMELGVTNYSYVSMLDRLDFYLQGDKPRFLDPALDDDWHTKVANLLMRAMKAHPSNSAVSGRIKKMPLIPVSDGSRLKNSASGAFFPNDSKGFALPEDLELEIVHPEALGNSSRRALFGLLEVAHCDPSQVIEFILKRYNRPHGVSLQNSISHLRYLFWYLKEEEPLDKRIYVMDQHERPVYRVRVPYSADIIVDDLYFQTPGRCGTGELSRKLEGDGQSTEILFIHEAYLCDISMEVKSNGQSWKEWLKRVASVRCVPRLRDRHIDKLSILFQNIAIRYPLMLVDMLKTYWHHYQGEITPHIIEAIKHMEVPCQNTDVLYPLKSTYFPSTELKNICSRAFIADSFDLFMEPHSEWATDTTDGWGFLANFEVGLEPDIVFIEQVLRFLNKISLLDQAQHGFFAIYQEVSIRFYDKDPSEVRHLFRNLKAVYIPATQTRPARMSSHQKCVWKGNPCLRSKYPLAMYQEYSENLYVVHLFKNMLCVVDACIMTYIEELRFLKASPDVMVEDLYAIYGEFSKEIEGDAPRTLTCNLFIKEQLVYIPTEQSWVSPEQCIWTAVPKLGGQFGIRATYAKFGKFFGDILNVQVPTTTTYINQLRILVSDQSENITAIKAAVHSFAQLRPSPEDLHEVQGLRFLPIEMADGSKILAKVTDAFFIADRIEYQAAFHGKVSMLDFSFEEVCRLHRLFESLSLEDRYMSNAVQEKTALRFPALEPSSALTHIFRKKVHHLNRCAIHFNAGRLQSDGASVLRCLQNIIIHESDGFKKTVVLSQNGLLITAETDEGLVYIDHSGNTLRIYVPRDPRQRQRCYSTQLPNALVSFLKIENRAAAEIFRLPCLLQEDVIESVLDDNGIGRIAYADIHNFDYPTEGTEEGSLDGITLSDHRTLSDDESQFFETGFQRESVASLGTATDSAPSTVQHAEYEPESSILQVTRRQAASFSRASVLSLYNEPSADTTLVPISYDSQYVRLLDHAIMLARRTAFPQYSDSTSTVTFVNGSPTQGLASGIRSENRVAHDIKIGAAGELYVFELLLQQNLPGFTLQNWRSNIRNEVNVHHEYRNLESWSGIETADLVYKDTDSVLTRILIDAGYLPQIGWGAATPTYFIEVKTTTGACKTPFYMSKGQYRRMQSMKLEIGEQTIVHIYMIFRVYNLGGDGMMVRIYLDPGTLKEEGMLHFTPESYSISPRAYY